MEPTINTEKVYSELKELGIEPHQVNQFKQEKDNEFLASVIVPYFENSNAILQIDFSASAKEKDSAPAIDIMLATLQEKLPSGETVQLMRQAFSRSWGPLPSVLNLQRRAVDCMRPGNNIRVQLPGDPEERIKNQFSSLNLNYADFDKHSVNENTIVATNLLLLNSHSDKKDFLIIDVILQNSGKENDYKIQSLSAEMQQWSDQSLTIWWKEMHFANTHTLPKFEHLYSRASETLSQIKNSQHNIVPHQIIKNELPAMTKKVMEHIQSNHVINKQQKPKM